MGNALLSDGDTGYHIRTGELIAQTWRIPYDDPYSYHYPPLKWTAHEWLSELVMATIVRAFGLTGVVVFFAFILATTHWLLYRVLRSKSDDILFVYFCHLTCVRDFINTLACSPTRIFTIVHGRLVPLFGSVSVWKGTCSQSSSGSYAILGQSPRRLFHRPSSCYDLFDGEPLLPRSLRRQTSHKNPFKMSKDYLYYCSFASASAW